MKTIVSDLIKQLKDLEQEILEPYNDTKDDRFYFACLGILNSINELKKVLKDGAN